MAPSLDIIIVNWNAGAQLRRCLDSVQGANEAEFKLEHVVVVDNASSDGSVDALEQVKLPVTIVRNAKNRGFAAACNQGAKGSAADYLLFLNPDTTLAPESLFVAVQFMQLPENSETGMCGIQLVNEQNRVTRRCSRFPKPNNFFAQMLGLNRLFPEHFRDKFMSEWDHNETRQVDVVTGAFLLVRRMMFESLGGFDQRFFVYLEDVDFLYAAHQAGWSCYYLATTRACHKEGGCSEQAKAARLFYSLRSRVLYGNKHFGWAAATGLLAGTILVEPFVRLAWAAWRRSIEEMRDTLQAYAMLLRELPALLIKNAVPPRSSEPSRRPLGSSATG
jgi:N-acetylglucosaminyl-diphospho-decaprenol L-rhamnosyltransferase